LTEERTEKLELFSLVFDWRCKGIFSGYFSKKNGFCMTFIMVIQTI